MPHLSRTRTTGRAKIRKRFSVPRKTSSKECSRFVESKITIKKRDRESMGRWESERVCSYKHLTKKLEIVDASDGRVDRHKTAAQGVLFKV